MYKKQRTFRLFIQIIFLSFFIFLFFNLYYGSKLNFLYFYYFDPLIFLIISISNRIVLPPYFFSFILIFFTLILGRFFCGFICPLGTLFELSGRIVKRNFKPSAAQNLKNTKYLILFFLIISALIGISFIYYFDPLVIFERTMTLVVFPMVSYFTGIFSTKIIFTYNEKLIALVFFALIMGLNFYTNRFWCQIICPLGAILAFLAKFAIFRFFMGNGCENCGICEKICPTQAIDFKNRKIDSGECIICLGCINGCPKNAIKYKVTFSCSNFDIKRRQLIFSAVSAFTLAPLLRLLNHRKIEAGLIRPPGSIPESEFLNRCIHCARCMKVCPTNGLQPCIFESGIMGLWTPRLVPRIGACEKNCNMCGKVCPTQAIRNLSLKEKSYTKIGTAFIDRARCIAWAQNMPCFICDEACQYDAIVVHNERIKNMNLGRPYVDEKLCTGCGMCEYRCPVEGVSAIHVYSIGAERKMEGSYITEEKEKLRSCIEKEEDIPSGFIIE